VAAGLQKSNTSEVLAVLTFATYTVLCKVMKMNGI